MINGSTSELVKPTQLAQALRVNGQVMCDCGCSSFRVGLAYEPVTGNNFIRLLECIVCGKQMPMVHKSDAQLAPSLAG
jgi:hypothetical protein